MSKSQRSNGELSKSTEEPEATNFQRALPQFLAVGVKNLLLFGYGMTLGFPTIVIPAIQGGEGRDPHGDIVLNNDQISWFSSINLLCVPLGCIFSGMFTQPIGKRRAMQLVNVPILGSWILFYFSTNIIHLYAGLCLFGLSGGLMEAPVLTYVAEVTEPKFRGMLAASGSTCLIMGVFTQFILGSFFKWRTIAALSMVLPVLSITALFFVPESPHWLMSNGRFAEAEKSLAWLRGWVPVHQVKREYDQIYDILVRAPAQAALEETSTGCSRTISRYQKRSFLAPYSLIALTFFIGHFSGKTTLQTYAVQIFHTLKAPIDKYYATIMLGAAEIIGTLVCVVLVHYTGKKPLVLISTVGCGLCFLGTATYAHFLDFIPGVGVENVVANVSALDHTPFRVITSSNITDSNLEQLHFPMNLNNSQLLNQTFYGIGNESEYARRLTREIINNMFNLSIIDSDNIIKSGDVFNVTNTSYSDILKQPLIEGSQNIPQDLVLQLPNVEKNQLLWLPLTLLLFSAMFAHMGIKLIPWMLIGEVFPSTVRSGASGISSGTGYMFGFFANKLFLSMVATMTLPGTFWFYSGVALIGACILYFVLPETEGRSLLEIERHFAGGESWEEAHRNAVAATFAVATMAVVHTSSSSMDHMKHSDNNRAFQRHINENGVKTDGPISVNDKKGVEVVGSKMQFMQPIWEHSHQIKQEKPSAEITHL